MLKKNLFGRLYGTSISDWMDLQRIKSVYYLRHGDEVYLREYESRRKHPNKPIKFVVDDDVSRYLFLRYTPPPVDDPDSDDFTHDVLVQIPVADAAHLAATDMMRVPQTWHQAPPSPRSLPRHVFHPDPDPEPEPVPSPPTPPPQPRKTDLQALVDMRSASGTLAMRKSTVSARWTDPLRVGDILRYDVDDRLFLYLQVTKITAEGIKATEFVNGNETLGSLRISNVELDALKASGLLHVVDESESETESETASESESKFRPELAREPVHAPEPELPRELRRELPREPVRLLEPTQHPFRRLSEWMVTAEFRDYAEESPPAFGTRKMSDPDAVLTFGDSFLITVFEVTVKLVYLRKDSMMDGSGKFVEVLVMYTDHATNPILEVRTRKQTFSDFIRRGFVSAL